MTQRLDDKPLFARVDPVERADAQAAADERFDGNLSMLVRIAVREYVARWRKQRQTEGEAA